MKSLFLLTALLVSGPVAADTLLIQRSQADAGVSLPQRGQSMSQVEAKFGAPASKHAAVGGGSAHTPPITRWTYSTYTVYFENSHVIKAVLTHANPNELGPKPVSN